MLRYRAVITDKQKARSKKLSPIMLSFRECGFRASNQGATEAASHHRLHGSRVMASSCSAETGFVTLIRGDLQTSCRCQATFSGQGPHVFGALDVAILGQRAGGLGQDEAGQQDDDAGASCSNAVAIKAPGQLISGMTRYKTEVHAP